MRGSGFCQANYGGDANRSKKKRSEVKNCEILPAKAKSTVCSVDDNDVLDAAKTLRSGFSSVGQCTAPTGFG